MSFPARPSRFSNDEKLNPVQPAISGQHLVIRLHYQCHVRKVFQDSRGFLWFGTERGLDRYDGHEFREFLPHGRERVAVYEIWEDNQGAVWAGTYGAGLARWTLGDSMCTWMDSSRSAIGGMYVTASAGDKQRNTWLGVDEAVVLLQPDGTVRRLGAEIGLPAGEIYAIAREEGSGTRDTFNELIMGSTTAETPGVKTVCQGSAEVKTAVTGSDKAIGYVGFSYAESGDVGVLTYEGVNPDAKNIKSGSYPLTRHLYFYTWGQPTSCAQKFIDFVLSAGGQALISSYGIPSLADVR